MEEIDEELFREILGQIIDAGDTRDGLLEDLGFLDRSLSLSASERSQNLALAAEQLGLSREDLFANANIQFRNLANNFATRGLGDSGFAQRARHEFGDQRQRDDEQLDLNFRRQAAGVEQQFARAQLSNDRSRSGINSGLDGLSQDVQTVIDGAAAGVIDIELAVQTLVQSGFMTEAEARALLGSSGGQQQVLGGRGGVIQ